MDRTKHNINVPRSKLIRKATSICRRTDLPVNLFPSQTKKKQGYNIIRDNLGVLTTEDSSSQTLASNLQPSSVGGCHPPFMPVVIPGFLTS